MKNSQNTHIKVTRYGKLQFVKTYAPFIKYGIKRAGHATLDFIDETLTAIDRERGLV